MKWALLLIAMGFVPAVHGQDSFECGPEFGDCYEARETPGCFQPGCCALVCEVDSFCCTSMWDETCVDSAVVLCEDVLCPNYGSCNEFHITPGCSDEYCCEHTRLHDPFCGWGIWDDICVLEAEELCPIAACELIPPIDAIEEMESCLDRTNDGCALDVPAYLDLQCGETMYGTCVTSVPRDTDWLRIETPVEREYSITLRSEFPGRLVLVQGQCTGPITVMDERYCLPCGELVWDVTLSAGEWFVIVDAGNALRTINSGLPCDEIDPEDPPDEGEEPPPSYYGLRYLLTFDCQPGKDLDGDFNGDGKVDGIDLGIFLVSWGNTGFDPADLNGDNVVNGNDLGLFLTKWTP